MKILLVQKVHGMAGSENYLFRLAQGLQQKGASIGFLCLFQRAYEVEANLFVQKFKSAGIPTHQLCIRYLPGWRSLKQISSIIFENGYTIVQSNLLFADLFLACTKWLGGRRFTLVSGKHGYQEKHILYHGFRPQKKITDAYYLLARFAERFVDRSFTISQGLFDLYVGLGICKTQKTEVIPYGFDFKEAVEYKSDLRFGNPQLCIVGRLSAYKGHKFALGAVNLLKEKYPDIKLVVVGWGEMELDLKKKAADLQISDLVCFVGKQSDARSYMAASDVVLVPSIAEGFGIVILESMSVKRPVVAFDVPSPNEILSEGAGVLVPPFNIPAFATSIDTILTDPVLGAALTTRATQKLLSQYSLENMINATLDFYRRATCSQTTSA